MATAFSQSALWFLAARFFTGAGIGGEYSAINSAIDEMIPARARGRVDLIINGSFWLGAVVGGLLSLIFLKESIFALDVGWRVAFGMGALLGLGILFLRRHLPESPRWLFIHGREEEAERLVDEIEAEVREDTGQELEEPGDSIKVRQRKSIPFREIARTVFKVYPKRAVLGFSLFIGQAFLYNAVTVTLGLTLTTYLGVGANKVGLFYAVFAAGNFLGPLLLGRLFDTVGRRPMIAGTYLISAAMLVVVGVLFNGEQFSDWGLTLALAATFFFASAGASSAYLTVSEIFPMEIRALAIAFFYAIGTAIGGITGPLVFQKLGESGDVEPGDDRLLHRRRGDGGRRDRRADPRRARRAAAAREHRQADHRRGGRGGDGRRGRRRAPRGRGARPPQPRALGARADGPAPLAPWSGHRLLLAVPAAPVRAQPRLARPRDLDHRPGAAGAGRARPAPSSQRGSGRATGARAATAPRCEGRSATGSCAGSAATATRAPARPPDPRPRAMAAGCAIFGHRVRFWTEGETMRWSCERECGLEGSKVYASAGEAARYARAFDREAGDDLGRRAPLSLLPLRLARRARGRA